MKAVVSNDLQLPFIFSETRVNREGNLRGTWCQYLTQAEFSNEGSANRNSTYLFDHQVRYRKIVDLKAHPRQRFPVSRLREQRYDALQVARQ
jgi:hypothetical protein